MLQEDNNKSSQSLLAISIIYERRMNYKFNVSNKLCKNGRSQSARRYRSHRRQYKDIFKRMNKKINNKVN